MKIGILILVVILHLVIFLVLAMTEFFYFMVIIFVATLVVGILIKVNDPTPLAADIAWGMIYGSIITLVLLIIFFLWLRGIDHMPF